MKDQLVEQINNHEVLHDFITHLRDFKIAVRLMIKRAEDFEDRSYWYKQLDTIEKLEKYVSENL